MRKELLINTIHLREIIHSRQKHIDLHYSRQIRARGFEDCREVLDAEFGHGGDGRGRESEDGACGVTGDLAGAVDCSGGGYGLRLDLLDA
jgi:hypothetical protein